VQERFGCVELLEHPDDGLDRGLRLFPQGATPPGKGRGKDVVDVVQLDDRAGNTLLRGFAKGEGHH
jgi:hypothetical protein